MVKIGTYNIYNAETEKYIDRRAVYSEHKRNSNDTRYFFWYNAKKYYVILLHNNVLYVSNIEKQEKVSKEYRKTLRYGWMPKRIANNTLKIENVKLSSLEKVQVSTDEDIKFNLREVCTECSVERSYLEKWMCNTNKNEI